MNDNIKIVRLVSGEEIIAKVVETFEDGSNTEKAYILSDILVMFAGREQGTIGIMPYLPYADAKDGIKINAKHTIFMVKPQDKLIEQYKQATSKIVTPPKPGLVLAK